MTKKILITVAHPDDEVLGVGGTAIKHVNEGDDVYCVILGEGITSRGSNDKKEVDNLKKYCQEAGDIIGFKEIFFLKLPDNKFDSIPLLNIVKEIEKYLKKLKPDIIYTHHENDLNIDHRKTFQAVITACRPCNKNCPEKIFTFETPSSTEWQSKKNNQFQPNCYINIEKEIETKIKALKKYTSEIRAYPHSRSIEGIKILAQYRGLESNLRYAESFYIVREIKGRIKKIHIKKEGYHE